MKKRCYDKSSKDYKNYGAKGIKMCDEWLNDFETFYHWALEHGYKRGLTIDRLCNSRGYSPGNCHWVPRSVQGLHRSNNTRIEADGKILTISQWSRLNGIRQDTIVRRLESGWDPADAVTKPVRKQKRRDE